MSFQSDIEKIINNDDFSVSEKQMRHGEKGMMLEKKEEE